MSPIRTLYRIGAAVIVLLGLSYGVESLHFTAAPSGSLLCAVEAVIGGVVLIHLWRQKSFGWMAIVMPYFFADLVFYLIQYAQVLKGGIWSGIATGLYDLSYVASTVWLATRPGFFGKRFLTRLAVPVGLVGVLLGFYFYPAWHEARGIGLSGLFPGWLEAVSVGVTALAMVSAFFTIIHSALGRATFLAVGVVIQGLVNIALTAEAYLNGGITFGFYEYFWAAGVFWIGWTALLTHPSERGDLQQNSIGSKFHAGVITFTLGLVLAAVFSGITGSSGIRLVSIAMAGGVVCALLLSALVVETVEVYSSLLGRALERGFTSALTDRVSVERLPVELETLFGAVFERSVLMDRERRERWDHSIRVHRRLVHDLRNPIRGLIGMIRGSDHPAIPDPEIRSACLDSLNALDRVSSGILSERATCSSASSVGRLLAQLERWFRGVVQQSGKTVTLEILGTGSEPGYVWIREEVLERLLMNVLVNATESPGCGRIRITLVRNQDRIDLSVEDDGEGCSDEDLVLLNGGHEFTRKESGHGLGLSGNREALLGEGGTLRFLRPGTRGFRVELGLPAASPRIVLIDDDRAIRLVWRTLGRSKGVDVIALEPDSQGFEELVSAPDPGLEIYVDLHLGSESGIPVLERLSRAGYRKLHLVSAEPDLAPAGCSFPVRDKAFPRV